MAAGSAFAASTFGPRLVTRYGFRIVAAGGLTLMGAGCALLSQVSTDGTYFGDLFFGLLIFGPGIGCAHLAGTVATLGGVDGADSGVASGLSNASFQIGAALGVAILTTVSLSQASGSEPLVALTEGSQAAFVGAVVFAAVGLIAALVLLRRSRPSGVAQGEPAVAASKSG
jgi:fucose permease